MTHSTLIECNENIEYTIKSIDKDMRSKALSLGIIPGMKIKTVSIDNNQGVLAKINDDKIYLNCEYAKCIKVRSEAKKCKSCKKFFGIPLNIFS